MEKDFWQAYQDEGVVVVGVSSAARGDPTQEAEKFAQKHDLSFPVLVDATDEVLKSYGVKAFPTNLVLGKDGAICYREEGFDPVGIKKALEAARQEADVPAP